MLRWYPFSQLAGKFLPVATIRAAEGDFYTVKYKDYEDQLEGTMMSNILYIYFIFINIICTCTSRSVDFYWNHDKEIASEATG